MDNLLKRSMDNLLKRISQIDNEDSIYTHRIFKTPSPNTTHQEYNEHSYRFKQQSRIEHKCSKVSYSAFYYILRLIFLFIIEKTGFLNKLKIAAMNGDLYSDSSMWRIMVNRQGLALAHDAMFNNYLPSDFEQWDIGTYTPLFTSNDVIPNGRFKNYDTLAMMTLLEGKIPQDFDKWDMVEKGGFLLFETALKLDILPSHFRHYDMWIKDNSMGIPNEITLAHIYVKYKTPPSDFKYWEYCDRYNNTVAHEAALYGHLPEDFKQWFLRNRWSKETVAHVAARKMQFPYNFKGWTLADHNGNTIAHVAAEYGTLPEGFYQWDLMNDNGDTVADIHKKRCKMKTKITNESNRRPSHV